MSSFALSSINERADILHAAAATRQHVIDPQSCFRCNTCESVCPSGAISHRTNYAIQHELCTACGDCVADCPTGAIDHWVEIQAETIFSVDEQLSWNELPELPDASLDELEESDTSTPHTPHVAVAPRSAANPVINRFDVHQPLTATLVKNQRLTPETAASAVHHIVLRAPDGLFPVLEGQTLGVIPPGRDSDGRPYFARAYSVASARDGDSPASGDIALTVKRVTGDVPGVASNYLCDLQAGDNLQIIGPFGNSFLIPDDPDSRLLMICTGTGIAPMRGMIQRRLREGNIRPGAMTLFYGGRSRDEMAYVAELQHAGAALDLHLALSREAGVAKHYVQDRLRDCGGQLLAWLQSPDTVIYLCGLRSMETGVEAAFDDICRQAGVAWPELAKQLRAEGRLHIETY